MLAKFKLANFVILLVSLQLVQQEHKEDLINSIGMKLKLIPAGSFIMGGTEENEIPVHRVIITKPFYIGVYEVTRDQYNTIMDSKIPEYENSKIPAGITWNEAVEFCKKLSEFTGNIYRLPTEAEWEYAARGGLESKKYAWGNNETPVIDGIDQANVPDESLKKLYPDFKIFEDYDDGYDGLAPVGSFAPNGYGLYDVAGNVWERCSDYYDATYYAHSPQNDPLGPISGTHRVLRGGGCWYSPDELRVASRCGSPVDRGGSNDGFRVVMEIGK